MLLSGLDNIDFEGFGSFGSSDMSDADLFSRFRNAMPPYLPASLWPPKTASGISDDSIRKIMSAVLSGYEIRKIKIPDSDAASIAEDVRTIILNVDPIDAAFFKSEIFGVVEGLKRDGFSLVPKSYSSQPSIPNNSGAAPQNQGSDDWKNNAAQGANANAQVGSRGATSSSTTQKPSSSGSPITDFVSSAINQIKAAWPKSSPQLPTQFVKVPYTQTAADKKRLLWIIGGFGVAFVLTIGVVASNNRN